MQTILYQYSDSSGREVEKTIQDTMGELLAHFQSVYAGDQDATITPKRDEENRLASITIRESFGAGDGSAMTRYTRKG